MYQITRNQDRYHFENDWLSTYWHFSFDHYYDQENVNFGPLRVFNDDVIQADKGFGTHGHKEMEIVTYVLDGELEHRDSTGGHGTISSREVQRMTAGTGIRHSEFNASRVNPVHLLQVWILPSQPNLKPGYEQRRFSPKQREGTLLPVVSGRNGAHSPANNSGTGRSGADPAPLGIHQDATFYVSTIRPEDNLVFPTAADRRAYLFVISGSIQAGKHLLEAGDVAKIWQETSVPLKASERSEIILIDLP
ncbi:MAG TPA: pirin family protein [Acidobacteriota bacterium]